MTKNISQGFVKQLDSSDCGAACLASLVKYYGGSCSIERLREVSGTSQQGTSLLGLQQAAETIGFLAEGLQAESIEQLSLNLTAPVILHVRLLNQLQGLELNHFIICYSWDSTKQRFLIGDPAVGISEYTSGELERCWLSRVLLTIEPTSNFEKKSAYVNQKRNWFLQLIEPDMPALIIATSLGIISVALSLSTALFSQQLVDHILPQRNLNKLWLGLLFLVAVLLVRSFLNYMRGWLLARQGQDLNNRLVNEFFKKLLYLPKSFFDGRKIGDLIIRLNDTSRIQQAGSYLTGTVVINVLLIISILGYVAFCSRLVFAFMLGFINLYWLITWRFNGSVVSGQRLVMGTAAINESQYIDTLQGISEVKIMRKEGFFAHLTQNAYNNLQGALYKLRYVGLQLNLGVEALSALLLPGVLAIASYEVVRHKLTLGEMVAMLSLVGTIVPAVISLALTNIQIQEAAVAYERMYEYSQHEAEHSVGEVPEEATFESMEFRNVDFGFPGRLFLLRNISFYIQLGEIITVTGASGTGKTTLFQLVQRFYLPIQGQILLNGNNWNVVSTNAWRGMVSVVTQFPKLFSASIFENVCLGYPKTEFLEFISFCQEWGFSRYFESLPQSYLTIIGEEGIALSGGQRQLVAIARALYTKPKLLLLDEPTSAMDSSMEEYIVSIINRIKNTTAIIVITHRQSIALAVDRAYQLRDGNLLLAEVNEALLK